MLGSRPGYMPPVERAVSASRRACRLRRIVKHLLERCCLGGDSVSPATRLVERESSASNASNASRLTLFVCASMYTGRKIDTGARVTEGYASLNASVRAAGLRAIQRDS
jgi:hypothetical protein